MHIYLVGLETLIDSLYLRLLLILVYASSEGSGKTVRMHRLVWDFAVS